MKRGRSFDLQAEVNILRGGIRLLRNSRRHAGGKQARRTQNHGDVARSPRDIIGDRHIRKSSRREGVCDDGGRGGTGGTGGGGEGVAEEAFPEAPTDPPTIISRRVF